jgi:hypothetical protein
VVEDKTCLWLSRMLEIIWPDKKVSSRLGEERESVIAQMTIMESGQRSAV